MKAVLKTYRQSPRKVRLVADEIRGKSVEQALVELRFLNKRAALPVRKLLESVVANARHNAGLEPNQLYIKNITVNKGPTLRRYIPRARGRATPINKRTSHIVVVLDKA
jgi:large subunit ribosomal protein L22